MKKALSLFLSLFLLTSLITVPVFAGTEENLEIQAQLPAIETLSTAGASFYTPFSATDLSQQLVLDKKSRQAVIRFMPSSDTARVYLQNADFETLPNAINQAGGIYSFSFRESDFGEEATLVRHLILENAEGEKQTISFTCARRLVDSPDTVVDYLCIGSQYSNGGNQLTGVYGLYPEKSLIGRGFWWSPISLGNFGGYITYYYEEPILNDPQNPYGIDFIVYGNSNGGAGFSEPGNVMVSADGVTWYTLAGSDHYEDKTQWEYTTVYERADNGDTIANGVTLRGNMYPSPENYPLYDWNEDAGKSVTVSGISLPKRSDGHAAFPAFGYADVRTNSSTAWGTGTIVTVDSRAKNPYLPVTKLTAGLAGPENAQEIYEGAGDCFDLDWAVDGNGLPVELDSVNYIKIQTATVDYAIGGIGEKSTEVNVVTRAMGNSSAASVSAPPSAIVVDGVSLPLEAGVYEYTATARGAFTVEVDAGETSNIYINNLRSKTRGFAFTPGKGLIRVIVQDGQKEPLIYYISVEGQGFAGKEIENAVSEAAGRADVNLSAPMSRAMLVAALHDLAFEPEPDWMDIREIPSGVWYKTAMEWAAETGVVRGKGIMRVQLQDGNYDPDGSLTKQEMASILYRYAAELGRDRPAGGDLDRYGDAGKVSDWAKDAMGWALGKEIIAPGAEGSLDPLGSVTGTEAAEYLNRFFKAMI